MIEKIIEFSIRNRFLVLFLAGALTVAGIYAVLWTPVDAVPDLSENQVIVFTDWMGRSPQEVEDQVTYPLVTNLQGLPGIRTVRGSSAFSFSMINIIFEDNIDLYWARTRVLERLNLVTKQLPQGVIPTLGPDATGVGQVFWYTLESDQINLRDLRTLQDWYVRYQLSWVPGRRPAQERQRAARRRSDPALRHQHPRRDRCSQTEDRCSADGPAAGSTNCAFLRSYTAHRKSDAYAEAVANRRTHSGHAGAH